MRLSNANEKGLKKGIFSGKLLYLTIIVLLALFVIGCESNQIDRDGGPQSSEPLDDASDDIPDDSSTGTTTTATTTTTTKTEAPKTCTYSYPPTKETPTTTDPSDTLAHLEEREEFCKIREDLLTSDNLCDRCLETCKKLNFNYLRLGSGDIRTIDYCNMMDERCRRNCDNANAVNRITVDGFTLNYLDEHFKSCKSECEVECADFEGKFREEGNCVAAKTWGLARFCSGQCIGIAIQAEVDHRFAGTIDIET